MTKTEWFTFGEVRDQVSKLKRNVILYAKRRTLVPEEGVEPSRPFRSRGILSPLRLPFRHSGAPGRVYCQSSRTLRWKCATTQPAIVPRTFQNTSFTSAARVGRKNWTVSMPTLNRVPARRTST